MTVESALLRNTSTKPAGSSAGNNYNFNELYFLKKPSSNSRHLRQGFTFTFTDLVVLL